MLMLAGRGVTCRRSSCRLRSAISPSTGSQPAREVAARGGRPVQPGRLRRGACGRRSLADVDPWLDVAIDWDRTIAYREHLWDLGLGVAEAMDTAQRGMGLDWATSLELIRRSLAAAKARGGALHRLRRRHRSSATRAAT